MIADHTAERRSADRITGSLASAVVVFWLTLSGLVQRGTLGGSWAVKSWSSGSGRSGVVPGSALDDDELTVVVDVEVDVIVVTLF